MKATFDGLRERIDNSISSAHAMRSKYREELLARSPELRDLIRRPPRDAILRAEGLLTTGTVAASDGTVVGVPLLSGAKIQVGVVIVSNTGDVVDLVTRIFEHDLASEATTATEFFRQLHEARGISNLLSRAVMLYGERRLLLDHPADWRMLHGELIPHELRTGAGRPAENLPPAFELVRGYVATGAFIAVSESPQDLDILNAAILLEPGEYMEFRSLTTTLTMFLDGDEDSGQARAKLQ